MIDVKDWLFGIYLPAIENPALLNKSLVNGMRSFSSGLDILGHFGSRITFRYYEAKADSLKQNPPYVPLVYYKRKITVFDNSEGPMSGEFTDTFVDYIKGFLKNDWKYNPPGTGRTSNDVGGYVIFFEKGNETENNKFLKEWIIANRTFNTLLGITTFDTMFYSNYYDYYAHCKMEFLAMPSGNVVPKTIINVYL